MGFSLSSFFGGSSGGGSDLSGWGDPFGILDFAKDQYGANRDWSRTKELYDSSQRFDERMSNTAYQRAVTDMESAGLNPMLAYQQGGASSPSQSSPTISRSGPPSGSLYSAAQVQNLREQTELVKAEKEKVVAETPGAKATSSRLMQEVRELVPVQIRTAQFEERIRDAAAYFAQFEKNIPLASDKNYRLVHEYYRAKFGMLPVELRTKMAELTVKELAAKAARGADEGYESMKRGARYVGDALGKVTNSAADLARGAVHGYERFHSKQQYRRKYEFDR